MAAMPVPLKRLIEQLTRLPGIGEKSATRLAFFLLRADTDYPQALADVFNQNQSGILGMFNMFSGGAVGRMAIFALNIMPYISASIIIQLMTTVSPHLEQLKKEGEQGRRQINQYTRYGTVLLAALQGYGIAVGLEGAGSVVL